MPVPIHSLGCTSSRAIPWEARHSQGIGRHRGGSYLYPMGVPISSQNTGILRACNWLCPQPRDTPGYQCWVPGRPGGPSGRPPTGWAVGRRLFITGSFKSTARTRGDLKNTIKAEVGYFLHPEITAIFLNYSFKKNCRVPPSSPVKARGAAWVWRITPHHILRTPAGYRVALPAPPFPPPFPFTPPLALTASVKREKILLLAWICTANRLKREVHAEHSLHVLA